MAGYSIQLDTPYGRFMMNRHDVFHPPHILQTGMPFMHEELGQLARIAELLPPAPVVVDAGANFGLISVVLGRVVAPSGGTVIAFEPQRLIYYMLCANVADAGLQNVICHQLALGECQGRAVVPWLDPDQPANFGNVTLTDEPQAGESVTVIALDDLGLTRLDLLKIDVETMELAVLAGARALIDTHRPLIWMEAWPEQYAAAMAWAQANNYLMMAADHLNFCMIPRERQSGLPLNFPPFDGINNPFRTQLQDSA